MKKQTSNKLMMSAAIVMGWTWLSALSCSIGEGPTFQGCSVSYDLDFPTGGTVSLNKPDATKCPLALLGPTEIPYAATADLPGDQDIGYGAYQNETINRAGYNANFYPQAIWSQGSNGRYMVSISGTMDAATGEFDANDQGYDDVRNGFRYSFTHNAEWVWATTRVTYFLGNPTNNVSAPSSVNPGTNYGVSATTNDPMLTNPVTWSWYVNNALVGTTANPLFTVHAGGPSTQQVVKVVASDQGGHSISGQTTVSSLALSAYISGYDAVNTDWYSTWTAHVSGGTPPYTYAWSGLFSGSGSTISGTTSTDGDLILDVHDASGAHVTDTKHISSTGCSGRNLC